MGDVEAKPELAWLALSPQLWTHLPARSRILPVKVTEYFRVLRQRPDRAIIRDEWIQYVIDHPVKERIQKDGRIRRWAAISEMQGKYLRVVLLPDGETIHNAFFDRSFEP